MPAKPLAPRVLSAQVQHAAQPELRGYRVEPLRVELRTPVDLAGRNDVEVVVEEPDPEHPGRTGQCNQRARPGEPPPLHPAQIEPGRSAPSKGDGVPTQVSQSWWIARVAPR